MRKGYLIIVLFFGVECFAQNKQILYNFTTIPQSLRTNPGSDIKYKWYFGVPLLSGISANVGSSGFAIHDLFAKDGVDFNDKLQNTISSSSRNDKVVLNEQIELFSGGFRVGRNDKQTYVSFGMYQELDFLMFMPKDIAVLTLDGNKAHLGKVFDLGDLNMRAEMLSVFHVGYHTNINKKMIFGVTAKLYSSIYNASSNKNSGYFYTAPADENQLYDQVVYSNLLLNTSGFAKYDDDDYDKNNINKDILKKTFFGGNLGLGLDVGFTYYPKDQIQITASILDIGFIKHTKEVESLRLKGSYEHVGIQPDFANGDSFSDLFQDFQDAIPLDTLYNKYTTWRPVKINSSVQYSFVEERDEECICVRGIGTTQYKNAVGAQVFAMTTSRDPFFALTAYYRRKILNSLQMKATYTLDSYSYKNIGLGLSSTTGLVNFYVLADNILEYQDVSKANSMSFQVGLNVVFRE